MATLLQFRQDDGSAVLVDVTPIGSGVQAAGAADTVLRVAESTFDQTVVMVEAIARTFSRLLNEPTVENAELEFGFQFTGKGSAYVVQSEAQAALKLKLTFRRQRSTE